MADSTSKGVAVTTELRDYLIAHSITQPSINSELVEATKAAMQGLAIMQIAEEQGPFLTWLARLVGTRRAVEIGRPFWERAGVADRIDVVIGPAADTLAAFRPDEPIDFAFIDADKTGYQTYYDILLPMMRPGGIIAFDNALYFGAVLTDSKDPDVLAIRELNRSVANDARVETVLLNVADGLLLARKL
jgi:caffeoyl-CoA O-methyltransferase